MRNQIRDQKRPHHCPQGIIPVGVLSSFSTRRRISNYNSGISILLEYLRCYIANRGFLVLMESDNSGTPGIGEALGTSS